MPKRLPVDHEKVKMVALEIGVREAARRFELSEAMVMQWSKREGWFAQRAEVEAIVKQHVEDMGVSAAVSKEPSEVLSEYNGESKLHMAHGLSKTAKAWTEKDDDYRLKNTQALANLATTHAKLFQDTPATQASPFQVGVQVVIQATPQE